MKSLLLLSVLFVSTLAQARPKIDVDYWAKTHLNFQNMETYLNARCHLDAVPFTACVQAVSEVALQRKQKAIFATPEEVAQKSPFLGKLIRDYGGLNLYEVDDSQTKNLKFTEAFKLQKQAQKNQVIAAQKLFASGAHKNVNFTQLFEDLKPEVIVGKNADGEARTAGLAINTFLHSAADPHTNIIPAAQMDADMNDSGEDYYGIGAELLKIGGKVVIRQPMEGSPALKAGILPKDVVTKVDSTAVTDDMPLESVVSLIRGPAGTSVKLAVLRDTKTLDFSIVRAPMSQKNVKAKLLTDTATPIGYVRLNSFMDRRACKTVYDSIADLQAQGAKGLIFDLRGNGGGDIYVGVCIGALFVGNQRVVTQKSLAAPGSNSAPKSMDYNYQRVLNFATMLSLTHPKDPQLELPADSVAALKVNDLPLVTLIDGGSASASELVAGALQDYQHGWIAGDKSFGKATVQGGGQWVGDKLGEFVIMATIARFFQPTGRTNQVVGIQPDFELEPFPGATEEDKFRVREADEYTNALPAVGTPWVQPRPNQVASVSQCVSTQGKAKKTFEARAKDPILPDYQILAAEDILACDGFRPSVNRVLANPVPSSENIFSKFLHEFVF